MANPDVEWKSQCDICHEGFDDPSKPVRLRHVPGTESDRGRAWEVLGYGTGWAEIVVHAECLARVGRKMGDA